MRIWITITVMRSGTDPYPVFSGAVAFVGLLSNVDPIIRAAWENLMRQRTGMMLLATALLLGACAAPAERSNMTVSQFPALAEPTDTSLIGGIAVGSVDGGQETNPLATSEVD